MYIEIQFSMGAVDNPIVPVRQFASSRPKLGKAVMSGIFFTDMDEALSEWNQVTNGAKEISVLFDSTLPGRKNIIKGPAKKGLSEINLTLAQEEHARAQIPAISGPDVSGFTLFFGMKKANTPYPRPVLDVVHWRNFFTRPGAYVEISAPTFERNFALLGTNVFESLTFRRWNIMTVDGP